MTKLRDIEWREPVPPAEWVVVVHYGACGSVHRVPELEARRIAAHALKAGMAVIDGPREATDFEKLAPCERDALLRRQGRSAA